MNYTPGPWAIETSLKWCHCPIIRGANYADVAIAYSGNGGHTFEEIGAAMMANARLIAAAPELLEACEAVLYWLQAAEMELDGPLPVGYAARVQKPVVVEKLRVAITKATKAKENEL